MTETSQNPTLAAAELHPWNTEFEWELPGGPFQVLTDEQAEQFGRDGYVVLENVFSADEIAAVLAEIDEREAKLEEFLKNLDGERISIAEAGAITFTTNIVAQSEELKAFSKHPVLAGLCADLIGPDANMYWDQAVYKKPQKPRRFPWHQDNGYTFVSPQQYLTCWVALTDATLENGCPQVARGCQTAGTLKHTYIDPLGWECFSDPDDVAVAEVGAGGIVVFSSLTPHLTGPNTTADVRKSYILQYAPAGAMILQGDPDSGEEPTLVPTDLPERQYPVLRNGERVA